MKISHEKLKKIVSEEVQQMVEEKEVDEGFFDKIKSGAKKFFGNDSSKEQPIIPKKADLGEPATSQSQPPASSPVKFTPPVEDATGKPVQQPAQQVPIFKGTPNSKGDVLSMRLKPLLAKVGGDQVLTQYLKMISNQLKANGIKLMEINLAERGENLAAQLGGFKSKTAQDPGTAANIQKGSIDLFGPAVMLLKQTNPQMDQKTAVTLAKQVQDITSRHLQKYGVNLPQKTSRVAKPAPKKTQTAVPKPSAAPVDFGPTDSGTALLNQAAEAEKQGNMELAQQLRDKVENMQESKVIYNKWQKIIKG